MFLLKNEAREIGAQGFKMILSEGSKNNIF
jgi:hypothetical protein